MSARSRASSRAVRRAVPSCAAILALVVGLSVGGCAADGTDAAVTQGAPSGVLDLLTNDATHGLRASLDVDGRRYALDAARVAGAFDVTLRDPAGAVVATWHAADASDSTTTATIDGQHFGDDLARSAADAPPDDAAGDAPTAVEPEPPLVDTPDVAADEALEARFAISVAFLRRAHTTPTGRALLALTGAAEDLVARAPDATGSDALRAVMRPGLAMREYTDGASSGASGQVVEDDTYAGCNYHVADAWRGEDSFSNGEVFSTVRARGDATCDRPHPGWYLHVSLFIGPDSSVSNAQSSAFAEAHHRYTVYTTQVCAGRVYASSEADLVSVHGSLWMASVVRTVWLTCATPVRI